MVDDIIETTPNQPEPEAPAAPPPQPPPPPSQPTPKRVAVFLGNVVLFAVLFVAGMGLSTVLRGYLLPSNQSSGPTSTTPSLQPTKADETQLSNWTRYPIVGGITFLLPPQIAEPVCDGNSCPSRGTYLPGGTRFTVASRGQGQALPDFRGAILTDAAGREFTMKEIKLDGREMYEYTGDFQGTTGSGYAFTKMRGVLVSVSDTLAIEFNHFAPMGREVDFRADDLLFEQIVKTLEIPTTATPTP